MIRAESRPSKKRAWDYIFFVDLEGHVSEEKVKKAIADLEGRCKFVSVLGSYPMSREWVER